MFQKKWFKLSMSFLFVLAMAAVFIPGGSKARAAEVKEVSVSVTDDIEKDSTIIRTESSGDYHTVYRFTLEKPASIKVSVAQSRFMYASLAEAEAGVYRDAEGTAAVGNGDMGYISSDGVTKKMWLEAGAYYIVFKADEDNTYAQGQYLDENGETSVGVACEYVNRSFSDNTSFEKAGSIKLNEDITGMFTDTGRTQYYKFTLSKPSRVEINTIAQKETRYTGLYDIILCGANRKEIASELSGENGTAETLTKLLDKGTYYIVIDASDDEFYYGPTSLLVKAAAVPAPAKPKVKSCRANTTYITGTAPKDATVYVSYNGKKYKAAVGSGNKYEIDTPKLKKGKTVKVYAVKDYAKSKVVTVKVK